MSPFSHFDDEGACRMVDVGGKPVTLRKAVARATVTMQPETWQFIEKTRKKNNQTTSHKGDVLEVARLAGIMAAKKTGDLIPLCHPIAIDAVAVDFTSIDHRSIAVEATVRTTGKTGVEMEALTAVSVAALTIYDMCKSVDRGMSIDSVHLREKSGGKSGPWVRPDPDEDSPLSP